MPLPGFGAEPHGLGCFVFIEIYFEEAEGRSAATGAATAPVTLIPTESPAGRPPKGVIGDKGVRAACGPALGFQGACPLANDLFTK
jgi:hypothetical protein